MLGTCIVFGGSGWTGSFLVSQLVKLSQQPGSDVKVFSVDIRNPPEILRKLHEGETGFEHCDICDTTAVNNLLDRINPQTIFHTASIVDLRQYPSPLLESVNVKGTLNILNHSKQHRLEHPKVIVYTSSIDVVSTRQGAMGADETTSYVSQPSNHYKRTKIIAEKAVLEANAARGLKTCALRPGHIFGPADILLPLSAYPIALGPPSARMSFSYVENCARAHILAAERLIEESTGSKDTINGLAGTPVFVCDFDTNFADTYRQLGGHGPITTRIPTTVARMIVGIAEFFESFFYHLFGVQIITHPVTGLTNAMLESCGLHTATSRRARKLFGYDAGIVERGGSQEETSAKGLIPPAEAIRRTVHFSHTGTLPPECYDPKGLVRTKNN